MEYKMSTFYYFLFKIIQNEYISDKIKGILNIYIFDRENDEVDP